MNRVYNSLKEVDSWQISTFRCSTSLAIKKYKFMGFPGGAVVKNLPAKARDTGSSPGRGTSHMLQSN